MTYYDMHSHIVNGVLDPIKEKRKLGINKSLVCIAPFVDELKCDENNNHYCYVDSSKNGEMIVHCLECDKDIRTSPDIFFNANDKLFEKVKNIQDLYYFATLPVMRFGMNDLAEKYIKLYKSALKGLKLYTGLSKSTLNDSEFLECDLPLLIHTGFFENQKPSNMIDFLKYYRGKIILAHFCRLDVDTIRKIGQQENIFFDVSPAFEMFERYKRKNILLYEGKINDVNEMYKILINLVGSDKILWGSDYPYSQIDMELQCLLNSELSDVEKEKILSINPKRFLER